MIARRGVESTISASLWMVATNRDPESGDAIGKTDLLDIQKAKINDLLESVSSHLFPRLLVGSIVE